jgi:methylated-DNA-[protein]-cysteine S-methyltransferase
VSSLHFQAKLKTPFALLGIRADREELAEIVFLVRDGDALSPQNRLAERACAQIERYVEDPQYRFDPPLAHEGAAAAR